MPRKTPKSVKNLEPELFEPIPTAEPEIEPVPEPETEPVPEPVPEPVEDPELIKKQKAREARQRFYALRKQKEQDLKETASTVKNDVEILKSNFKNETDKIHSQLKNEYLAEIQSLRDEIAELKSTKKKERQLKKVEYYGEEPDEPKPVYTHRPPVKINPYNLITENPFNKIWH